MIHQSYNVYFLSHTRPQRLSFTSIGVFLGVSLFPLLMCVRLIFNSGCHLSASHHEAYGFCFQRSPERVYFGTQFRDYSQLWSRTSSTTSYFKDAAKRYIRGLLAPSFWNSLMIPIVAGTFFLSCTRRAVMGQNSLVARLRLHDLKNMYDFLGQIPTYIIVDALDECPKSTTYVLSNP